MEPSSYVMLLILSKFSNFALYSMPIVLPDITCVTFWNKALNWIHFKCMSNFLNIAFCKDFKGLPNDTNFILIVHSSII